MRRTLVIDSGQPRNRFASHVHNVLGHDGRAPSELLALGRGEAERYGVEFRAGAVTSARDAGAVIELELDGGELARARGVVLATGVADEPVSYTHLDVYKRQACGRRLNESVQPRFLRL